MLSLKRHTRIVLLIAAASLAVRLALATHLDVFQDEALYWWGAQEKALSFSPHPPATYLMVRLGTAVFGDTLLGLRAGPLVWGTVAIVLAYVLGRDLYGSRAGVWSAGLLALCPMFAGTGAATTPDSLLVSLWLLFVWAGWRGATWEKAGWWALCGLALALGLYTKYMMVLAPPALLLALCGSLQGRRTLRSPLPWAALVLGVGMFVPMFLGWNWAHGWASFHYHLASRHVWSPSWKQGAQYVLTHVGALTPLVWLAVILAFVWAARAWRRGDGRGAWVLAFGAAPILFFLPPSAFTASSLMRVQWDAVGYAVGLIAVGGMVGGSGQEGTIKPWLRRLGVGAVALAGMVTGSLFIGLLSPEAVAAVGLKPPTLHRLGWRELATRVAAAERAAAPDFIVTDSFPTALALGFHRGKREGIYTLLDPGSRRYGLNEQLSAWHMDESHMIKERRGRNALYVHEHVCFDRCKCGEEPARVQQLFQEVSLADTVSIFLGGRMVRCFHIYRATGLRPTLPP